MRLVYFALLLGGAFNQNQNNVGVFVLVEVPILFFLSCSAYFVINWCNTEFLLPLVISLVIYFVVGSS